MLIIYGVIIEIYFQQVVNEKYILRIRQMNTCFEMEKRIRVVEKYEICHLVLKEDTFSTLLVQYPWTSTAHLIKRNAHVFPIGCPMRLQPGTELYIPANVSCVGQHHHVAEIVVTKQIHTVLVDDTVESIVIRYKMTRDALRMYNRSIFPKGYRGELRVGMNLVVDKRK